MSPIREALHATQHRPWPIPRLPWAMAMTWRDLLFAHWEVPVEKLRAALPEALPLDLFEGRAFVGVVPFRMTGIRGRFMPPVPGHAAFPELNVRTYVSINNKPGVYFFSLDATNPLAIATARATFSLNYLRARITTARVGDTVSYSCERTDRRAPAALLRCSYTATGDEFAARPGSLEHWLTERYSLYTVSRMGRGRIGRIVRMGEIHHPSWPLRPVEATFETLDMTRLLGFELEGPPASLLMADRIDVPAWLPRRVRAVPSDCAEGPQR